jgi:hypothetical protein
MWTCNKPSVLATLLATTLFLAPQLVGGDDDSDLPDWNQDATRIEQEFAGKVETYKQLLKQKRFNEAIVLGEQARVLQPDNPDADLMVFKANVAKENAIEQVCITFDETLKADLPENLGIPPTPHGIPIIAVETIHELANGNDEALSDARSLLGASLERRIQSVDRICRLTDLQKRKLRLAGRGDIQRFLNRIEGSQLTVERRQVRQDGGWEPRCIIIWRSRGRGLFEHGSLFSKTLKMALTDGQGSALKASTLPRQYRGE